MKRLLALLLCLMMCVSLIPAAAAEDIEIIEIDPEDGETISLIDPEEPIAAPDDEVNASKPTITASPKSVTAYVGTTVKFTVKATGATGYQWYYRTSAEGSWKESTASSASTATLSVVASGFRSGYQYYCKVRNSSGTSYSKAATLTVTEKPVVTTQPASKSAAVGTTVKFTVKADGAKSWQWYYRTSSSGSWAKSTASSATTATLSIAAEAKRDGYQYRCKVTNAKGSVYSEAATLTVISEKPKITTNPLSYVAGGEPTITFKVKATGAESYQWYYRKNSEDSWKTSSLSGSRSAALSVKATEERSGYQYCCKVTNAVGSTWSKAATLKMDSGHAGKTAIWKLSSSGLLTFGGTTNDYYFVSPYDGSFFGTYSDQIKRVTIEDGLRTIDADVFSWCKNLKSVTIPSSVTSIGDYAFAFCSSLTKVTIPENVTSIGRGAFSCCGSLTAITAAEGNGEYSSQDGVLFNKDKTCLLCCPGGKLGSYTVPSTVKSIDEYAFRGSSLSAVVVDRENENYSTAGGVLFNKDKTVLLVCPGGKTGVYTIPAGVTEIGDWAFDGCGGLTSISLGNDVIKIGWCAFNNCSALEGITIPDNVADIGGWAFRDCTSMTNVTIGKGVTTIGACAFKNCVGLTSVRIPDNVTEAHGGVFYGCSSLKTVSIGRGIHELNQTGFCLDIDYGFFGFFEGCMSLESVTIPNSVTEIGGKAFHSCSSLTSVTIGKAVTCVDYDAFCDCSALANVYYRGTKTQWGKIEIREGNDPLLSATMHYNA